MLIAAYFLGVALIGAALGAVAANWFCGRRAGSALPRASCSWRSLGAAAAMYLQRYFIIVGTAFGGAWTMIVGAMALIGDARRWRRRPAATCGWPIR